MSDELKINRPIDGEIGHYGSNPVPQKGAEEFLALIDEALAVDGVDAIRWDQYTPYFNDGDACEFGTNEVRVRFNGDTEGGDYDDGFQDSWTISYKNEKGEYPYRPEGITDEQVANFPRVDLGPFQNVIRANFGDPAEVTATKDGFSVEFYEHE